MTLHYMQTARLNAQPLARHIDTPEQAQPVYTDLDTMIADMMEDARQMRQSMQKIGITDNASVEQRSSDLCNVEICEVIKANPGCTTTDISKQLGASLNRVHARLGTLMKWGCIRCKWISGGTKKVRAFYVVPGVKVEPPARKVERASPSRDKLIAFIRKNPGCTTGEIAEHMGRTGKKVAGYIWHARKVVNIRTEFKGGNQTPARHWVED